MTREQEVWETARSMACFHFRTHGPGSAYTVAPRPRVDLSGPLPPLDFEVALYTFVFEQALYDMTASYQITCNGMIVQTGSGFPY